MRIRRIRLRQFAGVSDGTVTLGGKEASLSVVYGLNEAGKSTLRRALLKFLFGFDARNDPDVARTRGRTWIEVEIELPEGQRVTVRRRASGNKLELLAGQHADDPSRLIVRLHRGLDRAHYEQFFFLDHVALREGGASLAVAGGTTRDLLAAALGGPAAMRVQAEIQRELEDLYARRGEKRKINALLNRIRELDKEIRELTVDEQLWREVSSRYKSLVERQNRLEREKKNVERKIERLELLCAYTEVMQELETARQRLKELEKWPDVPPELCNRAIELLNFVETLRGELRAKEWALQDRRSRLKEHRAYFARDPRLEAVASLDGGLAETIRSARDDFDRWRAAAKDAVARLRTAILPRLRETLAKLGISPVDPAACCIREAKRVTTQFGRERLQQLEQRYREAVRDEEKADRQLKELATQMANIQAKLDAMTPPLDEGRLDVLASEIAQASKLLDDIRLRERELAGVREQRLTLAGRLGLHDIPPEQLLRYSPPVQAVVKDVVGRVQQLSEKIQEGERELDRLRAELQRAIDEGQSVGDRDFVAAEGELQEVRNERDRVWSRLRVLLEDGARARPDASTIRSLVTEYEELVRRADVLADDLRQNAAALERQRQRNQRVAELNTQIGRVSAMLEGVRNAHREAVAEFYDLWGELRDRAPYPSEAVAWLGDLARLRELCARESGIQNDIEADRNELSVDLLRVAGELGVPTGEGDSLEAVLEALTKRVEALNEQLRQRHTHEGERKSVESQIAGWQRELQEARARQEEIRHELVGVLRGKDVPGTLAKLRELVDLTEKLEDALDTLRSYGASYQRLRELLHCSPEISSLCSVEQGGTLGAATLVAREYAGAQHRLRALLDDQTAAQRIENELDELRRKLEEHEQQIGEIREKTGLSTCGEFTELIGKLQQREALIQRANQLEQKASGIAAKLGEAVPAEGGKLTLEALRDQIDEFRKRKEEIDKEIGETIREATRADQEFREVRSRVDAALTFAQEREAAKAELTRLVRRYCVLKGAARLLEKGIASFAEKSGETLRKRGGQFLDMITGGRYRTLRVEDESNPDSHLWVVRGDGEEFTLDQLSEGTRDQLFLSTRLAVIEMFLESVGPVPLLFDDVLVNFDDQRSERTLQLLAELGKRTQVLLFTHHQRVKELARRAVPDANVCDVELVPISDEVSEGQEEQDTQAEDLALWGKRPDRFA